MALQKLLTHYRLVAIALFLFVIGFWSYDRARVEHGANAFRDSRIDTIRLGAYKVNARIPYPSPWYSVFRSGEWVVEGNSMYFSSLDRSVPEVFQGGYARLMRARKDTAMQLGSADEPKAQCAEEIGSLSLVDRDNFRPDELVLITRSIECSGTANGRDTYRIANKSYNGGKSELLTATYDSLFFWGASTLVRSETKEKDDGVFKQTVFTIRRSDIIDTLYSHRLGLALANKDSILFNRLRSDPGFFPTRPKPATDDRPAVASPRQERHYGNPQDDKERCRPVLQSISRRRMSNEDAMAFAMEYGCLEYVLP